MAVPPGAKKGHAVPVQVVIEMSFTLKELSAVSSHQLLSVSPGFPWSAAPGPRAQRERALVVHDLAADDRPMDDAAQAAALVRRRRVTVVQAGAVDDERGVRIPDDEVGVAGRERYVLSGARAPRAARAPRTASGGADRRSRLAPPRRSRPRPARPLATRCRPMRARNRRPRGASAAAAPVSDRWRRDRCRRRRARARAGRGCDDSLMGGAHLNAVAPSAISSAANVR